MGLHDVEGEGRLKDRAADSYEVMQLRGGAANIERRMLRVRFVGDLLWEFGFTPTLRRDAVSARVEGLTREEGQALLRVAGYMTIHTRQLDMIMTDSAQVRQRHNAMQAQCRALFTGERSAQGISAQQDIPPMLEGDV